MIPFIHVPDLAIPLPMTLPVVGDRLSLHPFGLLVATGVIIGTALATRRARHRGFDLDRLNSFVTWMLVAGFIGGHMLDEIFYHPSEIAKDPLSLIKLWTGLSSFGGFTGALIGIVLWKYFGVVSVHLGPIELPRFFKRKEAQPILPFADLILSVFPVAWIFGRGGCSVVHDHPGAQTVAGAILAVAFPAQDPSTPDGPGLHTSFGPITFIQGTYPRYDLGTLELLFTVVLAFLVALTWNRKLATGTYIVVTSLAYAPVRFAMDFLRVRNVSGADPRYAGLTPAQWECTALFVFGLYMLYYVVKLAKSGKDPADLVMAKKPDEPPAEPATA